MCQCDWCTSLRHSNSWLITFNIYHDSIFWGIHFFACTRVVIFDWWAATAAAAAMNALIRTRYKSTGTIPCCRLFIYLRNRNIPWSSKWIYVVATFSVFRTPIFCGWKQQNNKYASTFHSRISCNGDADRQQCVFTFRSLSFRQYNLSCPNYNLQRL